MKGIVKLFRIAGDAAGLLILLGGLMMATNNARLRRASAPVRGEDASRKSVRALNARRAGAAV